MTTLFFNGTSKRAMKAISPSTNVPWWTETRRVVYAYEHETSTTEDLLPNLILWELNSSKIIKFGASAVGRRIGSYGKNPL